MGMELFRLKMNEIFCTRWDVDIHSTMSELLFFLINLQIRHRQLTAEFVVRTFIQRIQEINQITNCVVDERFELAIEEAKRVDALIQSGEFDDGEIRDTLPLLGVPFTIKDSFCV